MISLHIHTLPSLDYQQTEQAYTETQAQTHIHTCAPSGQTGEGNESIANEVHVEVRVPTLRTELEDESRGKDRDQR